MSKKRKLGSKEMDTGYHEYRKVSQREGSLPIVQSCPVEYQGTPEKHSLDIEGLFTQRYVVREKIHEISVIKDIKSVIGILHLF